MNSDMENDAIGFKFRKTEPSTVSNEGVSPYSTRYNMNNSRRGYAIIFNHMNFDMKHCPTRRGTNKDRDDLVKLFENLKFTVRSYNDLNKEEIRNTLMTVALNDHTKEDCLVVVVLSHGEKNKIFAKDTHYAPELLWMFFDGSHCSTLIGKPKLFFIQACRGEEVDKGVKLKTISETDSGPFKRNEQFYSIPVMADILVMYSTVEDYLSWRSPSLGSYFIQSLIRQVEAHSEKKDLLSILTYVNREVAIGYSEEMNKDNNKYANRQMCCIVSMLTRELYL